MFNLPKPQLGEITAITITSPDLERSLKYYQQLGFFELFRADSPFPWIQITDGALLIMIRFDITRYIALTYYVREIDKVIAKLQEKRIAFISEPKETDMIRRYLFRSPDGLNISLVNIIEGFTQPPGPTMITMPPQDYFKPEKYPNAVCGLYGEFAHPVHDLEKSIIFWQELGFNVLSKFENPYPWAIISDGLSIIGLHQSKHFSYPAITFFASDMKDRITRLRSGGLNHMSESGTNVVLITPEQQHINLFSLGI